VRDPSAPTALSGHSLCVAVNFIRTKSDKPEKSPKSLLRSAIPTVLLLVNKRPFAGFF
jgi:hypothetical protein